MTTELDLVFREQAMGGSKGSLRGCCVLSNKLKIFCQNNYCFQNSGVLQEKHKL
jgi:hypothetical protein